MSDVQTIKELYEDAPVAKPPRFISDYIEGNRVLPSNTPFPGPWRNWRSHYAIEIMDCMSPYNPIQHVDEMSASFFPDALLLYSPDSAKSNNFPDI